MKIKLLNSSNRFFDSQLDNLLSIRKRKVRSSSISVNSIIKDVKKRNALFIPPYNWITIYFKENQDSLLTLCNYKYDKKEYISLYKDFKKIISK